MEKKWIIKIEILVWQGLRDLNIQSLYQELPIEKLIME